MTEMTMREAYDQGVLERKALEAKLGEMQRALLHVAAVAEDGKGKIRVPKGAADDVVDVNWKVLKSGSVVFTVVRQEPSKDG